MNPVTNFNAPNYHTPITIVSGGSKEDKKASHPTIVNIENVSDEEQVVQLFKKGYKNENVILRGGIPIDGEYMSMDDITDFIHHNPRIISITYVRSCNIDDRLQNFTFTGKKFDINGFSSTMPIKFRMDMYQTQGSIIVNSDSYLLSVGAYLQFNIPAKAKWTMLFYPSSEVNITNALYEDVNKIHESILKEGLCLKEGLWSKIKKWPKLFLNFIKNGKKVIAKRQPC
jgi:hypothetical protein